MTDLTPLKRRNLTAAEFQGLADVPAELEWFANIRNEKEQPTPGFCACDRCVNLVIGEVIHGYLPAQSTIL